MALLDRTIAKLLPAVPKPLVQRISARYIAGTTLDEAVGAVRELNGRGKLATIDVLGEEISSEQEAAAITQAYHDVFEAIERERLDSNVSVKLTGLGLKLAYDVCRRNLESVVVHAAGRGNFVRIDMEDSSCTNDTLRLYRELRADGHDNVGVVLQSYLRRTIRDVGDLLPLQANVRLCKGIYVEPPSIAYTDYQAIRDSFVDSLEGLLDGGCYVGIATHDDWLVERGLEAVQARGLGPEQYEFQMLLGVKPQLGDRLVADGHRLRIYVPFGDEWYGYSLRRLQENPKIAGYVAADTVNRVFRRNGR